MGDAARGRQQDRPDHRRTGRLGQHARERHHRSHGGAVVAAPGRTAQADRLLGDGLSVDGAPLPRAAGRRVRAARRAGGGRSLAQHRADDRRDRRQDRGRRVLARALPHVLHHRRRRDRRARAPGRRRRHPRHVSVGGHHPGRRRRARRRLHGRRLPEVAVRRPRQRVPLHPSRSAEDRAPVVHRMAVAPASVRLRHRRARTCATMRCT